MNIQRDISVGYPYMLEIIGTEFSDLIPVLGDSDKEKYVIGGAIRDIIANMPLVGDVDIIENTEHETIIHQFERSTRWATAIRVDKSRGTGRTFKNIHDRYVDIIRIRGDVYKYVPTIDFLCCCVAMNTNGYVFELVEGAESACKKRVLTMNPTAIMANIKVDKLQQRIEKLTARGWKSMINIEDVKNKIAVSKEESAKKEAIVIPKKSNSKKVILAKAPHSELQDWVPSNSIKTITGYYTTKVNEIEARQVRDTFESQLSSAFKNSTTSAKVILENTVSPSNSNSTDF